ncbi:MAG: hypothetical protein F4028_14485 [Acidimicrobiaceae bacterium]|nr:hypothetical protein [Acidimicrobiaceae bacterium]MYD07747.1 hypothetical protein [Acidimicrobiaceae bacterium]MYG56132.1 hypothetical protein [Acidimicrobiaceae bacterium]MYI57167.1 hypothetical protein [Acidimicrobiaceae bacterium]MYK00180.1 hypothetical protein [Acidimicrobiaceae bacterium]
MIATEELGASDAVDDPPVELEPVTLAEWETRRLEMNRQQAGRLEATGWLSVSPEPEDGRWKVTAKQWVGGFAIDGLRVIVRPKIKPENLFLLLEVGLPPDAWLPEAIDYAETDDLLAALISFFARTAETTLARGHYHAYRHEEADVRTLRGRLDFHRQFRRVGQLVPMACSYDDFTADVIENRYLKAAMQRAVRVPGVPMVDRRRIRRMLAALEDVADLPMEASAIDRVTFTRLNDHYLPAMRLARLILANLTLQDQHGDTSASAFMLDMNYLFERFVTERLRAELIGQLDVEAQLGSKLDTGGRVSIQPDLLFNRLGQCVGVADIKYKLSDSDKTTDGVWARNADYYQLLAYTTALDHRCGTLIYCVDANETGDGDAADRFDSSTARLAMSSIEVRNVGTRLHAVGIDLSGSPQSIRDQITALADHLVGSLTEPETATVEVVAL